MKNQKLNEVYLRGRISHIYGSERYGSITIPYAKVTAKRVRTDNETKFEESVETFFPEALFNSSTKTKNIIQSFHVGDRVLIKGYLGSFAQKGETGYKERTVMYIEEISPDMNRMEQMLGVRGIHGQYEEPDNEIHLEAKVTGLTKRRNYIYELRLECEKDGHIYPVTGTYFRAPANLENRIHLNDTVYVIGLMESARNEYRGKAYFTQTFVIQELVSQAEVLEKCSGMETAKREDDPASAKTSDDNPANSEDPDELAGLNEAEYTNESGDVNAQDEDAIEDMQTVESENDATDELAETSDEE